MGNGFALFRQLLITATYSNFHAGAVRLQGRMAFAPTISVNRTELIQLENAIPRQKIIANLKLFDLKLWNSNFSIIC